MLTWSSRRLAALASILSTVALVLACEDSFSVAFDPRESTGGQGGSAGESTSAAGQGGEPAGTGGRKGVGSGAAGSGSKPSLPHVLELTDASLPNGSFNASYEHSLDVTNAEGDVTFSMLSGELPNGLELSEDGRISGVPREAGEFTFELRVTDEEGGKLEMELTLEVKRKRWLAYVTGSFDSPDQLYVADVTQAKPSGLLVSGEEHQLKGAGSAQFAPNGRLLAYTANKAAQAQTDARIYLVDLSGATPVSDGLAYGTTKVAGFGWSPNSRYIGFTQFIGIGGDQLVYVLDLENPGTPIHVGAGSFAFWLGNKLVFWTSTGGQNLHFVTVEDGQVSEVSDVVGAERSVPVLDAAQERAGVKLLGSGHCNEISSSIVAFASKTRAPGPAGATRYSPDLQFVATSDGTSFSLRNFETWASAPSFASGAGQGCDGIWSPDSKWFVFENTDSKLMVLSSAGGANQALTPMAVTWPAWTPGGVSPQGHPYAGFSPDGRWFRFHGDSRAQLSRVTSSGFGSAVAMTAGAISQTSWISPDSRVYVLWEEAADGTTSYRLFDISGDAPEGERVLVSLPPSTGAGLEREGTYPASFPLFSSDSSLFAYRAQVLSGESSALHVIDLLDENAEGTKLSAPTCGAAACFVRWAGFEP